MRLESCTLAKIRYTQDMETTNLDFLEEKYKDRQLWYKRIAEILIGDKFNTAADGHLPQSAFYISKAFLNSRQTNCLKAGHGCVIVRDNTIISDGYNGVPRNYPHPTNCARLNLPSGQNYGACVIPCLHAEQNAIYNAARLGAKTEGAELFVTGEPCLNCCEAIIQAGIEKVFYATGRPIDNHPGLTLLIESGVTIEILNPDCLIRVQD
jgi:dCMP deaminase